MIVRRSIFLFNATATTEIYTLSRHDALPISGRNTLRGGEGGDTISGDYGEDRIYGGEGDDTIEAGSVYRASVSEPDGRRDLIDCGPGTDTVSYERDVDRVEGNCEYKYRMPVYPTPNPEASGNGR